MQILLIVSLLAIIALGWIIKNTKLELKETREELVDTKKELKEVNNAAAAIFDEKDRIIDEKEACIQYLEKKQNLGKTYQLAQKGKIYQDMYPKM